MKFVDADFESTRPQDAGSPDGDVSPVCDCPVQGALTPAGKVQDNPVGSREDTLYLLSISLAASNGERVAAVRTRSAPFPVCRFFLFFFAFPVFVSYFSSRHSFLVHLPYSGALRAFLKFGRALQANVLLLERGRGAGQGCTTRKWTNYAKHTHRYFARSLWVYTSLVFGGLCDFFFATFPWRLSDFSLATFRADFGPMPAMALCASKGEKEGERSFCLFCDFF